MNVATPEKDKVKFSKQFTQWEHGGHKFQRCAIISNSYNKSFEAITKLRSVIMSDFPDLTDSEIELVVYGGRRIKGIMGLEFSPGSSPVPASYTLCSQLETTLH